MESTPIDDAAPTAPVPSNSPRGLEALVSNLVDYAGLFPPARLDMATTVANYAAYLEGNDAWMLERLIVPVARLDEFEEHAATHLPRADEHEQWPISALTAPAGDEKLDADLERIAAFNTRHAEADAGRATIETIELKATSPDAVDAALDRIPDDIYPFFELPVADDPRGLIATLVGGEAGAKVRTGGITADLYPSPADVARFIDGCAAAGVPFKATAGMHHPLRHFSAAVETHEFGFLNVFAAGALAMFEQLSVDELIAVLEEDSIDAFTFDHDGMAWAGRRLDADDIEDARLSFAISFGCCSFDDPRNGLAALGLLHA